MTDLTHIYRTLIFNDEDILELVLLGLKSKGLRVDDVTAYTYVDEHGDDLPVVTLKVTEQIELTKTPLEYDKRV